MANVLELAEPPAVADSPLDANLVLGIDPGLNLTGYGVVDISGPRPKLREAGVIKSRPSGSLESRLAEIHDGVAEVLAAFRPSCMSLEALYSHYDRPTTAIMMGHARGVICLAAAQAAVPIHHYASTQIKKMLTGNGRAPKLQVQTAICREFGLPQVPEPPDVADALAIALCHIYISRV